VSERTGETTSPTGDIVPIMSVREVDTVVRVYEGETVVVAGLMQDRITKTQEKVKVLGSIPLLGRMFRRNRTVESKTDLVILLTPRIVTPGRVSTAMLRPD
jgi:type II secretory pathway component GspD/PulD (secretin)